MTLPDPANPPDTDEPARERKRRRKVWNERLKLGTGYVHALALAVLGFGAIRFALDPSGPSVGLGRFALVILASFAIEAIALYLLRYLRSED